MEKKSGNPFLNNKSFTQATTKVYNADGNPVNIIDYNNTMTVNGAISKTAIMFVLLLASASVTWYLPYVGVNPLIPAIVGAIVGLVLVIIASFSPKNARYLAPAYALFEGMFIGGISLFFNAMYPGIVLQAVGGTFVTFAICLALYRFGVVKVTEQFRSIVIASTLAIGTFYLLSWILTMFGVSMFHHGSSLMSIGFSVFVIVIAAMNLFLDFDAIEQGAKRSLPKYMEWFGAMGLIITLVWLYFEFLKLLAKLQSRD
jgi:uncharacterized YccA/Bax inhibitor family protein